MNKDHYPFYGVALVAGAALAVWAGMPFAFLLFLVCPLMMFFMMKGMGGMHSNALAAPTTTQTTVSTDEPKRL
jgi:L-asparagine transporter-like permease